jgi:hypothetical protein
VELGTISDKTLDWWVPRISHQERASGKIPVADHDKLRKRRRAAALAGAGAGVPERRG